MMTLLKLKAIESIPDGATILVGFSGGPDSMALVYHLKEIAREHEWRILALYVHHSLRPEADAEALFLEKWCASENISYRLLKVDVPSYAEKEKKSIEEAAHDLRYASFFEVAKKEKVDILALGHHAGDRAETFLMHLLRGAGLSGLSAMPAREGWIWRPFIDLEKAEILAFCKEQELPFVTDQSNFEPNCQRNKIRQELIPFLEAWHPHISKQIAQTAERLEESSRALDVWAETLKKDTIIKASSEKIGWSIPSLLSLPIALKKRLLYQGLKQLVPESRGLNAAQWDILMDILESPEDKQLPFYQAWTFKKVGDVLYLCKDEKIEKPEESFSILWQGEEEILLPLGKMTIARGERDHSLAYFSTKAKKLRIRSRKPGDRIRLANLGRKTLKKIFQEQGIPQNERKKWPIVENEKEIIWVPGLAIAEGYAILDTTKDDHIVLKWKR